MTSKDLPGHIQAAINRNLASQNRDHAGRPADSAGVAWDGRDLKGEGVEGSANPLHAFDTDDGLADPDWLQVTEDLVEGNATEADVVKVLAGIRVFAAVIPTVAESVEHTHVDSDGTEQVVQSDKQADVALVSLESSDGRKALPVFTSVPALTAWHPDARPVAAWMPRACLSAVDEGSELVVVDPGQELTFVVRRPAVWALAQQREWIPSYTDNELARLLGSVADIVPGLHELAMTPGRGVGSTTASGKPVPGGGSGPELTLLAAPKAGLDHAGVRLMLASLRELVSDIPEMNTRVDTLEISLPPAE